MKFTLGETGAFVADFEYGNLAVSSNTEIGFRPVQLLVSSLVGCSGGLLKGILEKKRIDFDSIDVDVEIERNKEEANKVTKIEIHYTVIGNELNSNQVQKSLDLAIKNCSMIQSVNGAIDIVETFEVKEPK